MAYHRSALIVKQAFVLTTHSAGLAASQQYARDCNRGENAHDAISEQPD